MTLEAWVKAGGNMLSDYAAAYCCSILRLPIKELLKKELADIANIPGAGNVAMREIWRFLLENGEQVRKSVRREAEQLLMEVDCGSWN